jgi:hypothetical protein
VLTAATDNVLMVLDDMTGDLDAAYDQWSTASLVVD